MIRLRIRNALSHPDRLSGLILMVVAFGALSQAIYLPFGSIQAPDAGLFPVTLSVLLLLFAVAVILNSFKRDSQKSEFISRSWYVLAAGCGFVIYALCLDKIGFVVATSVVLLLLMRTVGKVT